MAHYMDYAATSAIRPPEVGRAVAAFLGGVGCSPGRGGHSGAVEAARLAFQCRRALARVMDLPGDPGRIAFMQNATHALNAALWGLLCPGDVLVISQYDHNAVLRPANYLAQERGVEVRVLSGSPDGSVDMDEAARLLEAAKVLAVNAASNVLGTVMPMAALCRLAREAGTIVVADVAQSAGHLRESAASQGADVIAFTGHKGLLGPQGTGGLWVREGVEVDPMLCGGTGGDSRRRRMPQAMPDRLEAGTGNAPGMAGLLAACGFLQERGQEAIHRHEMTMKADLIDGFSTVSGLRILSPPAPDGVPVVTVQAGAMDAATLADRLDREHGVQTRAGLHCAPEVHRILGTLEEGAVRFSLGWASTRDDVECTVDAVDEVLRPAMVPAG